MPLKKFATAMFVGFLILFSQNAFGQDVLDTYYRSPGAKAITTSSGLAYEVLTRGKGRAKPTEKSTVIVHYTGWLASDGTKFDSSVDRGVPATLPLDMVIPGWTEGLQLMRVNQRTRFWIPVELAYKNRPNAPMGDLVFDVQLLAIKPEPKPITIQAPPMSPSKKATITESGLAYQTTRRGTGGRYPQPNDTVVIHYSAWQASNGEMFDSSVMRGKPIPLRLRAIIPGLSEGLRLMVVGQKTRFWIPPELAYGKQAASGGPSGLVVYEVELVDIRVGSP